MLDRANSLTTRRFDLIVWLAEDQLAFASLVIQIHDGKYYVNRGQPLHHLILLPSQPRGITNYLHSSDI